MRSKGEGASGRLKSRGSIDDNWEETLRLYDRLADAGLCPSRAFGQEAEEEDTDPDDENDGNNWVGVTFSLDEHEGNIDIYDSASDWGPIGTWRSEAGFFVLCMENHKRPFHRLRSIADAVAISQQLTKLSPEQRKKFHPPLRMPYADYD
jgi:hypothetical protein